MYSILALTQWNQADILSIRFFPLQDFDGFGHMDLHQFVCRLRLAHVFINHMDEDEVAASAPPRPAGGTFSSPSDRSLSMSQLRMSALERQASPINAGSFSRLSTNGMPINQGSFSRQSTSGMPKRAPEDLRSSGHAVRYDWELEWRLETLPRNEEFDLLLDTHDGKVCTSLIVVTSFKAGQRDF